MTQQFKAILWDNDGILVNTEPLYAQAVQQVFDRIGFVGDAEELYKHYTIRLGTHVWDPVQKQLALSEEDVDELRQERDKNYEILLDQGAPIIPHTEEVLKKLRPYFSMGIVTSCQRKHLEIIHTQTGFFQYFDFRIAREDFVQTKPNPEPYLLAFKKVEALHATPLQKNEILVIEDSERGVISAKEAGMTCFAIPTSLTKDTDLSRADRILESIEELPSLVLSSHTCCGI
ncbi:HAD family phosphatase [Candidatus Gracilibacteria bacterium]|nr:HAD family phosphatase [Candidatus Gracilibacteria bacterium]